MLAYLVYIKYTQDEEDGSSSMLPDKPSSRGETIP
jgi:hypothetical protein